MPPAARVGDLTGHPGTIGPAGAALNVLIENMPAATAGTQRICSFPGPSPHPPSVIVRGSATVLIGNKPAARMGDMSGCGAPIVKGALTVMIGG
jgi:uncharacterized Zn-binding protein involved in type VI secretion